MHVAALRPSSAEVYYIYEKQTTWRYKGDKRVYNVDEKSSPLAYLNQTSPVSSIGYALSESYSITMQTNQHGCCYYK
jgi:hypothetical protein